MAELPTPLSAVHRYAPASSLSIGFNGKLTTLSSFVHVMFAGGGPTAKQSRDTESPSFTVVFGDMPVISGGPMKKLIQNVTNQLISPKNNALELG